MPTAYHVYGNDEEPVQFDDVADAAWEMGWDLRAACDSDNWTLCRWRQNPLLSDGDQIVGVPVGSPFRREVWEYFDRADVAAIERTYAADLWGRCTVDFHFPCSLAIQMTQADIRLIRERHGADVLNGLFFSRSRHVLTIARDANRQSYDLIHCAAQIIGRLVEGVICNPRDAE